MPRYWFLSEDDSMLVQLQHDLITLNWRRRSRDAIYPGYTVLGERIEAVLRELEAVLREDEDRPGQILPNWCEVTYVNQIEPDPDGGGRVPLDGFSAVWMHRKALYQSWRFAGAFQIRDTWRRRTPRTSQRRDRLGGSRGDREADLGDDADGATSSEWRRRG